MEDRFLGQRDPRGKKWTPAITVPQIRKGLAMLLHAASGSRQGGVVRSEPMAGAPPLHRRRSVVDRQQRQRTDAPPPGDRRKNWLFLGSEQAGPRADVLFTVLAGAKRRRIEPG